MGLEELESIPAEFPLAIRGEVGKITQLRDGGQVSFDLVFEGEEAAREEWRALQGKASSAGFKVTDTTPLKKRERVVLEGEAGRLELGCCPQRADRKTLVFVTWWAPQ